MQALDRRPMDRTSFRASPSVGGFLTWAGRFLWAGEGTRGLGSRPEAEGSAMSPARGSPHRDRLATLPVRLVIPRSRFVPTAIAQKYRFGELPLTYIWRAPGMAFGDIGGASRFLEALGRELREAVARGGWQRAQAVCLDAVE